ncbi:MAG TPA: DUF3363 domain-containing protein [Sphingomonas sp.]|nr:DUF3363 domain-containing protein [Sphingomonas sp.]
MTARGATWLDRQLVTRDPMVLGSGFGRDVAAALAARSEVLIEQGLGHRSGAVAVFVPHLVATLAARTGRHWRPGWV